MHFHNSHNVIQYCMFSRDSNRLWGGAGPTCCHKVKQSQKHRIIFHCRNKSKQSWASMWPEMKISQSDILKRTNEPGLHELQWDRGSTGRKGNPEITVGMFCDGFPDNSGDKNSSRPNQLTLVCCELSVCIIDSAVQTYVFQMINELMLLFSPCFWSCVWQWCKQKLEMWC